MTEEQIERRVEHLTDAVDRALMAGRLTEDEYNAAVRKIDRWAEQQYRTATKP